MAQVKSLGLDGIYLGIAKDDFDKTKKSIQKGLRSSDILILSGGVSVGDYDFVYDVLRDCGVKILFDKVAIKPGKPMTFGVFGKKLLFGLPGNPVSAMVIFDLFVSTSIKKMMNQEYQPEFLKAILLKDFKRRDKRREEYYPVRLSKDGVLPLDFHGSGHMHAFIY